MADTINLLRYPICVNVVPPKEILGGGSANAVEYAVTIGGSEAAGHYYQLPQYNQYRQFFWALQSAAVGDGRLYLDIDAPANIASVSARRYTTTVGSVATTPGRKVVSFPITGMSGSSLGIYLTPVADQVLGFKLYGARLTMGSTADDGLGVFSGDTPDTATESYSWAGLANESQSIATSLVLIEVSALPVTFSDTLRTYNVPTRTGVQYLRDGAPIAAGSYAADWEEAVTITAAAEQGYKLIGATEWAHVFPVEPETLVARVMRVLGHDADDADDLKTAQDAVGAITMMVKAYTRGRGFTDDVPNSDVDAVIFTAAVRYLANPSGLAYRAGTEQVSDAFRGWTLAETFVLNSYRKRWA